MDETLTIAGKIYTFVTKQRQGETSVYRTEGEYLRIGEAEAVKKDLALHKKMEAAGFPVAKLLSEGEQSGLYYFTEASLGDRHLGKLFAEDFEKDGTISDASFGKFLAIVETFARAQLSTATNVQSFDEFSRGFHFDTMLAELPEKENELKKKFEEISKRVSVFPFVVTHGDFNPNNLYEGGVIDLEDSFYAPFGYDLVTALVHINYFPDSKDFEYFARYRFSDSQTLQYTGMIDSLAKEANLPPLSAYADDFEFARAVWSVVHMGEWPKIQKWRYDLFTRKFLT